MISPAAKAELTPTGKLRVGINFSNELLTKQSTRNDPEPRGIALDLARELARRLDVPLDLHRSLPRDRSHLPGAAWILFTQDRRRRPRGEPHRHFREECL